MGATGGGYAGSPNALIIFENSVRVEYAELVLTAIISKHMSVSYAIEAKVYPELGIFDT